MANKRLKSELIELLNIYFKDKKENYGKITDRVQKDRPNSHLRPLLNDEKIWELALLDSVGGSKVLEKAEKMSKENISLKETKRKLIV